MDSNDAMAPSSRIGLAALIAHAVALSLLAATIASGAYVFLWPDETATFDHRLLGVVAVGAVVIELMLFLGAWLVGAPRRAAHFAPRALYLLLWVFFAAALGAAYVVVAVSSPNPEFLGASIPPLAPDVPLAEFISGAFGFSPELGEIGVMPLGDAARLAHRILALAVILCFALYLAAAAHALWKATVSRTVGAAGRVSALIDDSAVEATALGERIRVVGWFTFWVQLFVAVACGLMFQLAQPGRAFAPQRAWYVEPIGWGGVALSMMAVSLALAYLYTRYSKRIIEKPAHYLDPRRFMALWFLWVGVFVGSAGVLFAFIGVAMSVWTMIGKIVSQPPGIAITDPTNFIRMLDMLILIANIGLLMGHVIGASATEWLRISASKVRLDVLHALLANPDKKAEPEPE